MNNLSSYCGLVDAKIRASDKDLPVQETTVNRFLKKKSEKSSWLSSPKILKISRKIIKILGLERINAYKLHIFIQDIFIQVSIHRKIVLLFLTFVNLGPGFA